MTTHSREPGTPPGTAVPLSADERAAVTALAAGHTIAGAAKLLGQHYRTVNNRVARVNQRLGFHRTVLTVARCVAGGAIDTAEITRDVTLPLPELSAEQLAVMTALAGHDSAQAADLLSIPERKVKETAREVGRLLRTRTRGHTLAVLLTTGTIPATAALPRPSVANAGAAA
ncbi:hypothetical protein Kpho02_70150 [Kitasatospora phosalacinea]|uniref:HTH luxR-type domain-containing protein n=1 Tax=Kitasatospora phosalacinea TaxID=2065 RepID=A0A9W6V5W9_9ACTN|nr:hypothetical protein [Kitasatospora phosalacinea]GLW74718.1 hypothetical protein Kpho02_70150 [Kitasatospora phosalacinea]